MSGHTVLCIDIGNTSTHMALCKNGVFSGESRFVTRKAASAATALLRRKYSAKEIDAAVIASVVPSAASAVIRTLRLLGVKSFLLGKNLRVPIANRARKPRQVGTDRLVNALAAYARFGRAAVVVDFGTAVTFDVVSKKGEYLGGVIAPGIEITIEALFQKTALLPRVTLKHPTSVIGRDTVESIRAGCSFGIGGMCDRLIDEIAAALGTRPRIIATGGYARFISKYCRSIRRIDPKLTLKGIYLSYLNSIG